MRYRLIRARKERQMSTAEVAEILGISQRMYQYIEEGSRTGRMHIWDKLEDLFEIHQRMLRESRSGERK